MKPTRPTLKIVIFSIIYAVGFYYFRESSYYNYKILAADMGSIPWLYSTIGLIFGIISAFIIQKEWQRWNDLVDSVKGEVGALSELWLWADRLPEENRMAVQNSLENYLKVIINEGWEKTEKGEVSEGLENAIIRLNNALLDVNSLDPFLSTVAFSFFSNIMSYREKRLRYGSSQIPTVLLNTLRLATILMIALCPLIAVKDHELQLLFSSSIAILTYTIYAVSIDMNYPLRAGGWHLTTRDYSNLLKKIEGKHERNRQ